MTKLILGTRASRLAMAQSNWTAEQLRALGYEVELVHVSTKGDRIRDRPLPEIGGKGLFTAELEAGLRSGELDLAVHSLKDLPVDDAPDLVIGAVPERAPVWDALITRDGRDLAGLEPGTRIGTSSTRRRAMLLAVRPDLQVVDLRGNVPTRVGKVDSGEVDAAVLAAAGLVRLGMGERATIRLEPPDFLPAPGQGALGIQVLAGSVAAAAVAQLEHPETRARVDAERTALHVLEGGCTAPLGALALFIEGRLRLDTVLLAPQGQKILRAGATAGVGDTPQDLGRRVAEDLLGQGAGALIAAS